ncbi:MAG: AAA family ATPase [Methylocystaceae bacterium]|nr:AAA family ATPase [Methylocystaceae bacterium]
MRIHSIWISDYKNLQDFPLELDKSSFLDVFVGKNGSGKSNLLEALIEIFHCLYENGVQAGFDFKISYSIFVEGEEKVIHITRKESKFTIGTETYNRSDQETVITEKEYEKLPKSVPLPRNILVYYSGQNPNVAKLLDKYENSFRKKIKNATIGDSRKFIGVGPDYKDILLSTCLLSNPESKASQFIAQKLGIARHPDNVLFVIKRPRYAEGKSEFDVDIGDPNTAYWKMDGIARECIALLEGSIKGGYSPGDIYNRDHDRYHLNVNVKKLRENIEGQSALNLFQALDNLKTLGALQGVGYVVELQSGRQTELSDFSDGQFQSVYIYALTEIFKGNGGSYIMLLDEPDAFLHPEWQLKFLDQVAEVGGEDVANSHLLMTSHSASTLCNLQQNDINQFKVDAHRAVCTKQPKKEIINDLSNSFIQYSEDESKLLINNVIRTSDKPVLFVEGVSDVTILNTAFGKLYPDRDIPVLIQDAFDRGFLKTLFSRPDVFRNHPEKNFFALFDFDDAYEDWRSLGNNFIENDIEKGLCKQLSGVAEKAFVFILPIPDNGLKCQVWDEANPTDKILPKPCFTIEHIFWGQPNMEGWFKQHTKSGNHIFKDDSQKVKFAEEIVPSLSPAAFDPLKPMFDRILEVCA